MLKVVRKVLLAHPATDDVKEEIPQQISEKFDRVAYSRSERLRSHFKAQYVPSWYKHTAEVSFLNLTV